MGYTDAFQMVAVVTVGFVKDAKDHVDVQGFNVYHKNRLIKVACQSLLYGQLQNQTWFFESLLQQLYALYSHSGESGIQQVVKAEVSLVCHKTSFSMLHMIGLEIKFHNDYGEINKIRDSTVSDL